MRTHYAFIASLMLAAATVAGADEEDDAIILVKPAAEAPKPAAPVATAPAAPLKPRFGPMDVEVRLADGSAIRGEWLAMESVKLKTPYGTLTYPLAKLLKITRGQRLTPDEVKNLEALLKQLDADGFTQRATAQQKLEALGPAVLVALRTARAAGSVEARNRIDSVIKKIESSGQPRPQADDVIRCEEFEAPGRIELDSFTLKSRIGELRVKFEDIESIRWLNRGAINSVDMECNAGLSDWIDTGVDSVPGQPFTATVSGNISINGNNMGPGGNPSWGNAVPYPTGSVIGRLGAGGQPFLIGGGKRWTADAVERLYIKIHWPEGSNRRENQCTGRFTIRAASGSWAEDKIQSVNNDN